MTDKKFYLFLTEENAMQTNKDIDHGKGFDWGKASDDYARYRDIYPAEFYQALIRLGVGQKGQKILDLGTGTGVLPRNLYHTGAQFTAVDISPEQIAQARELAETENKSIDFLCTPAEKLEFSASSFDIITACQCFFYFEHEKLEPQLVHILKKHGKLAITYMAWLPFEDEVARKSEQLVLSFNPEWSGKEERRHEIEIPDIYFKDFEIENRLLFDIRIPFTRESWNGRMKACRGIGASLSKAEVRQFDAMHKKLLEETAPERFEILHYAAIAVLKLK